MATVTNLAEIRKDRLHVLTDMLAHARIGSNLPIILAGCMGRDSWCLWCNAYTPRLEKQSKEHDEFGKTLVGETFRKRERPSSASAPSCRAR